MNEIYHIDIDKEIFGIEDAKEAAQSIFSLQQRDFESIINEKWYRRFLSALTLHSGDRKKVIKSISSLSKLQSLFMKVYCEHYRMLDEDLNKVIDDLSKINTTVRKLYQMCVAQIRPQQSLADLTSHDKQILLLLLSKYQSLSGADATLQKYRAGIATVVAEKLPEGEYDNTQLLTISAPKVFYRCLLEMCALDGELDSMTMPDNIYDAFDYLNISPVEKKNVENTLRSEVKAFGEEYLLSKYTPEYNFGTCAITDASEMEIATEESKIDSNYSNDAEDLSEAMGTYNSSEEKDGSVRKSIEELLSKETSFWLPVHRCSLGEQKKILSQMAFAGQETTDSIVGVYDIDPFHAVNGRYSGILFLTKGFYFKKNDRTASEYMSYSEIGRVEEKFMTLVIHGKKGTVIRLNSASYVQSPLAKVFRELRDSYQ